MTRAVLLTSVIVAGVMSMAAAVHQAPVAPPRVIAMDKLRDNLYVLTSSSPTPRETFSGGNVAVLVTDEGVTLVDSKLAGWGQAVLDKVTSVTDKPVVRIINTHTHGDHTGNDGFFGDKVEIVAHEHTRTNMATMDAFKGEGAKFLPSKTFSDKLTIGRGKDQVDLYYFGAGHTSGDTFVVFPALRVLHTGDMFAWKDGPLCDRGNGGSCVAFPKTLAALIGAMSNIDTVIPGHSPMATMADVQEYQRFTADLLASAEAAMKAGKTVDEATAAFDATKYPGYRNDRVKGSIQAVYDELSK